jgi:hypothetical protein
MESTLNALYGLAVVTLLLQGVSLVWIVLLTRQIKKYRHKRLY